MSLFTSKQEQEAIERCRQRKVENERLMVENRELRAEIRRLRSIEECGEIPPGPPMVESVTKEPPQKITEPLPTPIPKKSYNTKKVRTVITAVSLAIVGICILFIVLSAAGAGAFQATSNDEKVPPTPVSAGYTEWGFTVPVDAGGDSVVMSNAEIYIDGKYVADKILFAFEQPAKLTVYGEGYITRPNGESLHVYQVKATGFSYEYYKYVTVYGIVDDGGMKYMQNLANNA